MHLKSQEMSRSSAERRWLPWFGINGKLRLGWSCWLNRDTYSVVEKTFEGIANTRRNHLIHWAKGNWDFLAALAQQIDADPGSDTVQLLTEWLQHAPDYSELFVTDCNGKVLASTCAKHTGKSDLNARAVAEGLKAPFLHGPYVDPMTKDIGASSSKFHDAVTLMFYQPLLKAGKAIGCLCGRIPNDVMGDIIQREAGHVYRDSGDNYIFMVSSRFDHSIEPGTALSRSRFEDDAFTGGDNLKDGVRTAFGTVLIGKHTELELRFTDPATKELHPGVRETISRGENLFVTYPGYPDYRHIPVIGKGLTFQMPGSPDRWGMMCEGDLEEAYRRRPIPYLIMTRGMLMFALTAALSVWGWDYWQLSAIEVLELVLGASAVASVVFYYTTLLPLSRRMDAISSFLLGIAECGDALSQRLDAGAFANNEIGELGRWINSFVDKIDDTVSSVLRVAGRLAESSSALTVISTRVAESSRHQNHAASTTASAVDGMSGSIAKVASHASATEGISQKANTLSLDGKSIVVDAIQEMEKTAASIAQLSEVVGSLDYRSNEINNILGVIRGVADQTNMLALNAAIEAARAGEQGRGFAVVADEVRKLAERTAQSTTEITTMIQTIQEETRQAVSTMQICREQVERGVDLATRAGHSLGQINDGADHTLRMVSEIVHATREQITTGTEIAGNIERIASMAEQNNTQVSQASRAARTLEQLAGDLQKAVSKFAA
ncbi:MAG: methyl-accepting chemotaxis protein [Gallionella sp.]|nr:methyl-accepting chemotaxis protein [Gallionella sp.]